MSNLIFLIQKEFSHKKNQSLNSVNWYIILSKNTCIIKNLY